MADFSRARKKGGANVPVKFASHRSGSNDLEFWSTSKSSPYFVDLNEFAIGVTQEQIQQDLLRWKKREAVGFIGRPLLIQEIATYFRERYCNSPKSSLRTLLGHVRWWWRFLDRCEEVAPVKSLRDLNDIHYAKYRMAPCATSCAAFFFGLVEKARADLGLQPLYWTAIYIPAQEKELPALQDVIQIYHWLKRPAFAALERFRSDPTAIPTRNEVVILYSIFLINTGWNPQVVLDIDVDSLDEKGNMRCIIPHPQSNSHSIVQSIKARARNSIQYATSNNKRQLSPHNIILVLLQQTEVLRHGLRQELNFLEDQIRNQKMKAAEKQELLVKISNKVAMLKSPWMYQIKAFSRKATTQLDLEDFASHIGYLATNGSIKYNLPGYSSVPIPVLKFASLAINRTLPVGAKRIAEDLTLTDIRDVFISWRYQKSGYSWLDAMLAAGHGNIESLRAYLNKRQHKAFSQKEFVKVTEQVWATIAEESVEGDIQSFPVVVAAKVAGVSSQQIKRWRDGKDRTYVGAGCANILNPPSHISPTHRAGTVCRVQRCTLCPENAILFSDSYIHLSKRLAELRYLQKEISELSWIESDFGNELEMTEIALKEYDQELVNIATKEWETDIAEGRHSPLTMEGSYT
ncbi:hypothetical protein [Undibacterium sp.]|uniref:hypothetical protein n=1 Tax=Undibacterium sp. TaxID=1914977 RepID=UPI0037538473